MSLQHFYVTDWNFRDSEVTFLLKKSQATIIQFHFKAETEIKTKALSLC